MDVITLHAITDLGDSALLLPLAMMIAVALWSQQSARAALVWLGALLPGSIALIALKLIGHTCVTATSSLSLISPSGHAALSAMVYGSLGVIAARHLDGAARWPAARWPVLFAAVVPVAAVAATRLMLRMHSIPEVAIGLAIGAASVALFARRYRALPPATCRPRAAGALLAGGLLLLTALHGQRLHAEEVIRRIAAELRVQASVCR